MRATGFNHVSVHARKLDESVRFYVEVFGMEKIPTYNFAFPVQYLRLGDLQLDLFERENLLSRANELGDRFQHRARDWQRRWSIVGDVRGLGGMQAIELVQSPETKAPAADETKKITQYCYEHGLIMITAGSYSNVVRILVPLVVTNDQLDEGLDVLESAIATVCDRKDAVVELV